MSKIKRNSFLCPQCRKLISRDEPRCPYCGFSRPGSRLKDNLLTRGIVNGEDLPRLIIYVNVAMYVISLVINWRPPSLSMNPLGFLTPDNRSLLELGATGAYPIDRYHRWWTLITANYLHGGLLHIAFNMIALYQLAPLVIHEYGHQRMFILYTLSGVAGYWISYWAGVPFTIGASAAVCGLLGALLYFGRSRGGTYGMALYKQVGGWAVGIFLFGLLVPGINNWAHGGGLLTGILLGYLLGYRERRPVDFFQRTLFAGCVLTTVMGLGWALLSSIV
jgi:rhomboid protease GluP